MQQALTQPNWQHPNLTHWLKHSLFPLLLVLLFLLLPKPWQTATLVEVSLLEIELKQTTESLVITPKPTELVKPEPVVTKEKNEITDNSQTKPTSSIKAPPKPKQQPLPTKTAQPQASEPITVPISKPKATTADILLSVKNRVSMDIPAEFQARSRPAKDFYIPQQEIESWLADIPFLDESVDRPTIHMQFYAEGFTGHIEKFFDKITFKKTFTTKYGTKIHCALIGVIAACGWK